MKRTFFCKFFSILLLCIFLPATTYSVNKELANITKKSNIHIIGPAIGKQINKYYIQKKSPNILDGIFKDTNYIIAIIIAATTVILPICLATYLANRKPSQRKVQQPKSYDSFLIFLDDRKFSTKPNIIEGNKWLKEGILFFNGSDGRKIDYSKAENCFKKASIYGIKEAKVWLENLKAQRVNRDTPPLPLQSTQNSQPNYNKSEIGKSFFNETNKHKGNSKMKTFTHPQTSQRLSIAQEIYNLPEPEFKKLYKQSNYLNGWGKFCFFGTFILTIGYALCTIPAFSFGGVLPALGVILAGALQALYIYSLSHLFRYQRNSSARSIISFYSIFHMVISGLVAICSLFAAFGDIKLLLTAVVPVILFIIFCIIFAASRNPLLFGESALSHEQIECIKYWREKRFFDAECLPKTREPKGSDAFFRIYSIIGIILLFLAIPVGFVKGVMENSASDPQEYVQKADQAMEKKNFGDAFNLYEKAAKQNLPEGIFNLGICYAEGIGCDEDFAKAYECFNHPDVKEAPLAKFYIGIMHYSGQGAPQDFQKAAELLKSAADSGVEAAQKFLGYQNGKMPDYDVPLAKLLKENFKQNEKN